MAVLACGCLVSSAQAQPEGITVGTADGLAVTFERQTGAVREASVGGRSLPLLAMVPGGVSVEVGALTVPTTLYGFAFDQDAGAWTAAHNADWDHAGRYVTWLPAGGLDGSAYLRLGDGQTTGAGMALAGPLAVPPGSMLRIAWHARVATTETTQILCVRVYDATGQDITASVPAPSGWGWTATSQAHAVWGLRCSAAGVWEPFEQTYAVPAQATSVRVSLRHWTGGDHFVDIDELRIIDATPVTWSGPIWLSDPLEPTAAGFRQTVEPAGLGLRFETTVTSAPDSIRVQIGVQDISGGDQDRPVRLCWTLPVAADGWRWWDDIATWRAITPDRTFSHTFPMVGHAVSLYPLASITDSQTGLGLRVPASEPVVQRFEYAPASGLRSTWELALSPRTTKLGPGSAVVSAELFGHDPRWGFRAAVQRYYERFPEDFVKRTRREGAWMYPIPPSQIADPQDFGFAFFETRPLDPAERAVCAQYDIGIFHYVEPWFAWQPWGNDPQRPSYDERVARLEQWAAAPARFATWQPAGGLNDSGHLLLGDGISPGAGMATATSFDVQPADTLRIEWVDRADDVETSQILAVRVFDAAGHDITPQTPAPAGWFYSSASAAHVVAGITNAAPEVWTPHAYLYPLPAGIAAVRLSLRHWNGGDHLVRIDDLTVRSLASGAALVAMHFETPDEGWVSARHADWDDAIATWLRAPRQQTAQAVLASSPVGADGRYLIDFSSYYWHEWAPGTWNQAWPLNPDPDLGPGGMFALYRQYWVLDRLDEADGVYIDSVDARGVAAGWENHRDEQLALADAPLTWSAGTGAAVQLAAQVQAEALAAIREELHAMGKLVMVNLFPYGSRFEARNADVMGSEVSQLVEDDVLSRLRRTMAGQRIVSNLLQWGWGSPEYISYAQMETFIRGQLFWGFYPAVSSGGGPMTGGAPDRYFLHPELYERDRPLFQRYVPVIRSLSSAGWEPITAATASPEVQMERFGAFSRGSVFLTVRGQDGAGVSASVTLDLAEYGLNSASWALEARDALADRPLVAEVLDDPPRLRFAASLGAGEVGVYQFRPRPVPDGDYDGDGDLDMADIANLLWCASGPDSQHPPGHVCLTGDLDTDMDVDLHDAARAQVLFGAPTP